MWDRHFNSEQGAIPQSLLDEPELMPGLHMIYNGFWNISTDRQVGMSLGPLPHTAIREYAKEYNLPEEDADDFRRLVRAMDGFYLSWIDKKREIDKKAAKKGK